MTSEPASLAEAGPRGGHAPLSAPFPVTLAGVAAGKALRATGRSEVLAVFQRSFYLEGSRGLACLGPPAIGPGPLNAICTVPQSLRWAAGGLTPGMAARLDGDLLRVGERFVFDLGGAEDWRPADLPGDWRKDFLPGGLAVLAEAVGARAPDEGLGRMIPELIGGIESGRERLWGGDPFLDAARAGAAVLSNWLVDAIGGADDGAPPPGEAEILVGLGPGLTPSGDDFLGGAMIASRVFSRPDIADRLASWLRALGGERTGKISAAHLAAAAEGQGAGALHGVLSELCRPGAPELLICLEAIDAVGHTSGWDALAGATAALAAVARSSSG